MHLPLELILQVVDALLPFTPPIPIAYPQSHAITKTLYSLCLTSRGIYPLAMRLLYSRCLYLGPSTAIDRCLVVNTTLASASTGTSSSATQNLSLLLLLLPLPLASCMTSLYIHGTASTDVLFHGWSTLKLIRSAVRRLVFDIPFRELMLEATAAQQQELRNSVPDMPALEVLACVRDDLLLQLFRRVPTPHEEEGEDVPPARPRWRKLRVLALYNQFLHNGFFRYISGMNNLRTLVLTRPDFEPETNGREIWEEERRRRRASRLRSGEFVGEVITLDVVIVNIESRHDQQISQVHWLKEDESEEKEKEEKEEENGEKRDRMRIRMLNVPISYYGDEDEISLCQEWVKRRFLRGEESLEE